MPLIATIVCLAGILWLFALDRDPEVRTSPALWIPTLWMLINGSRTASQWLTPGATQATAVPNTEGSPLDVAIFALLILAGVVVLNFRARRAGEILRRNLPLILFFAYCAVSILWSAYGFIALKRYGKAIGDVVMVLLVLTDPEPLGAIKRFFKRVTFILLPVSVLLIYFYPSLGTAYDPTDQVMMFVGVTTFKNMLGLIVMLCGIASVWSFFCAYDDSLMPRRSQHMLAHGIMVLAAVFLLLKCDSMTSFSCFCLAGGAMVMSTQRWTRHKPGRVHLVVIAALALPLFALFMDTAMVHILGRKPNLTDRTSIWAAVLAMHTNPLLGSGFESFWMGNHLQRVWDLSVHGIQEAHNGYLEVYVNLGWIGELLLAAMVFDAYPKIVDTLRRMPNLGKLALAYLIAGLTYSLTEAGFRMMDPVWISFLLAIVCPALRFPARERAAVLPVLGAESRTQVRVLR